MGTRLCRLTRPHFETHPVLGLPLTASGFHYSILSPFRDRPLVGGKEAVLLERIVEARNRTKRETNWTGYVVHLTETCSSSTPNSITHVETTPATVTDDAVLETIHQELAAKDLLPEEQLADAGYTTVDNLRDAAQHHQVDLIGPLSGGKSWQANAGKDFYVNCFSIDWDQQVVTCPQGHQSRGWHLRHEKYGHEYIAARFAPDDGLACPHRSDCTRSKRGVRTVTIKPQAAYALLQAARARQETEDFKQQYKKRAGVEGAISQGTRAFDLRRSRYWGLAKTHLQHLATAAAYELDPCNSVASSLSERTLFPQAEFQIDDTLKPYLRQSQHLVVGSETNGPKVS